MADRYADLAPEAEVRETHISRVLLLPDEVIKIKKPVELGFLDFRTVDRRREACEAEVRLNRRLAPEVYRGVSAITREPDGGHALDGSGEVVDWAVRMARLRDDDSAEARLATGRLDREVIARVAERICEFHAGAAAGPDVEQFGDVAHIRDNVVENFAQTRDSAPRYLSAAEVAEIERWQLGFLEQRPDLFAGRIEAGRVRDGHGDLRLEHVYIDEAGAIQIIDCIEFNDRFRYGDVCADVAFLAMDLSWHRRGDLAEAFLAAYASASNDYDLYGLVDFYQSYRAYVRGKVSSFVAEDSGIDPDARERAAAQARKYYLLSRAYQREPLVTPAVYAVGGIIATGKSTVARELARRVDAPIVDADRTRKHLSGVGPTTSMPDAAFAGHYSEDSTDRVYGEMLRRARCVLTSGRPVILDASFRASRHREAALALAREHGLEFWFVECRAPREVCRQRLEERARGPSVSDGRLEILDTFADSYEPVTELPGQRHLALDTTGPIDSALDALAPGAQPD